MSGSVAIHLVGTRDHRSNDGSCRKAPLPVALVYDVDDIATLRQHGVVGVLVGTLAGAPQQNVFLGVPLRLMIEEAVWLVDSGLAHFVSDTPGMVQHSLEELSTTESGRQKLQEWEQEDAALRAEQLQMKRQQLLEKLRRIEALRERPIEISEQDEHLMHQSVFVETKNTSRLAAGASPVSGKELTLDPKTRQNYLVYKSLKEKGYFMSPGARFGGRYVAYPGDPLRFHSHLTVQNAMHRDENIDLLQMINGARLGTSVKKTWVLPCVTEDSTSFYSIEWAGFG